MCVCKCIHMYVLCTCICVSANVGKRAYLYALHACTDGMYVCLYVQLREKEGIAGILCARDTITQYSVCVHVF